MPPSRQHSQSLGMRPGKDRDLTPPRPVFGMLLLIASGALFVFTLVYPRPAGFRHDPRSGQTSQRFVRPANSAEVQAIGDRSEVASSTKDGHAQSFGARAYLDYYFEGQFRRPEDWLVVRLIGETDVLFGYAKRNSRLASQLLDHFRHDIEEDSGLPLWVTIRRLDSSRPDQVPLDHAALSENPFAEQLPIIAIGLVRSSEPAAQPKDDLDVVMIPDGDAAEFTPR